MNTTPLPSVNSEDPVDELDAVRSLTAEQVDSIASAFGQVLPGLLKKAIDTLKEPSYIDVDSLNDKFLVSQSKQSNNTFAYSDLATFFGGLVKVLGAPSVVPSLEENMRREHVESPDSMEAFTTSNYRITTTPQQEWEFVVSPQLGRKYPYETVQTPHARQAALLDDYLKKMKAINEKLAAAEHVPLRREEIIALRLYTGPMFTTYNSLLRKVLNGEVYTGNRYVNTIIAINSGILKLSKIQKAVKVFRGLSGRVLPEEFWQPNAHGVMGGVEMAFMSATTSEQVALNYAKSSEEGKPAFLFEIQMGMVDRGADLSPFSQYPYEKEIVFAPLTGMEVVGTPRTKDECTPGSLVSAQASPAPCQRPTTPVPSLAASISYQTFLPAAPMRSGMLRLHVAFLYRVQSCKTSCSLPTPNLKMASFCFSAWWF
ncbi:hypothetical protein CYMTET_49568 [Cymbomonas tetramitiformis]|uniref:NAD(P)(+)--arginine ADP-ribosyltransferase n=1 Tax=Cymbomonas tetramitiformis TaxID=36881 RepID=A0AAE0BPY2_9CHLO|nr:hypothetical protein CYMTET_49568 [Cymbomonas tetramitiformis]